MTKCGNLKIQENKKDVSLKLHVLLDREHERSV